MRQIEDEKGNPTDNPTGNQMPEPSIFTDGSNYNARVYFNMVSGTENDYDIDFRDMSAEPSSRQHAKILGTYVNTHNMICFNHCDGVVRIKDNHKDKIPKDEQSGLRCDFRDNVVIGNKPTGSSAPGKSDIGYKYGNEGEVVNSDGDFAKALQDFIYGKTAGDDKIKQS